MANLEKKAERYFQKYKVEDLINPNLEILFILESPHTQEVKYGYPVAGSSGREMSRFIYGSETDIPFGKLAANFEQYSDEYKSLDKFGLLNTASAPMQKRGLQEYELEKEEQDVIKILEKLRVNYKAVCHQKQDWNIVKEVIIKDFESRLEKVIVDYPQLKYLVPCGKFASSYLELIKNNLELGKIEIIEGIPHPSFNQWHKYDTMDKLKEILNKI